MKKVLVLVFHPRMEASRVNKNLMNTLLGIPGIKVKDMYELYPDFNVDVRAEKQDLSEAELVVMQHPFFWYSAPPLLKQWIDLVLEHGWAYGKGGEQLKGKNILHVISSGGTFEAYSPEGRNLYTYNELLRPFELTYRLCQMKQLPPYIIPGANRISPEMLNTHCSQIKKAIEQLAKPDAEFSLPEGVMYLNELN